MTDKTRIKLKEAARILDVSTRTLRRWIASGKTPAIRSHTGRLFVPDWWVREQITDNADKNEISL